jgi:hypothetical protein
VEQRNDDQAHRISARSPRFEISDHARESDTSKKKLRKTGFQLFRSLVDRKIIELKPELRINVDLQEDFSLHHALALYLIDTIALLDPTLPEYAFDLLTLVESILENPDLILRKQLDRAKDEKMAEMKMEGVEYDDRIAELENVEYPKPNRDFIYDTFNRFADAHPWVGQENIRPKSIAREMFENFQTFPEYIREYDLHRAEGLLLRYLSEVYKTLIQTVPNPAKTDEVESLIDYFGAMIRQIDSSLLDEWERMRNPNWVKPESQEAQPALPPDITRNKKAFTVLVRNEVFRVVRALAGREYPSPEIEAALAPFYDDHKRICTDPKARAPKNTVVHAAQDAWKVEQVLVDPDEHNDWMAEFEVDLAASREQNRAIVRLTGVREIG